MIKKSLTVVALAFMIIFSGSQSNIAEANKVYIGTFGSNWATFLRFKELYLFDDSIKGNSYSVNTSLIIQCAASVSDLGVLNFTFRRVSTKDWVFMYSFSGGGTGITSGVTNVDWNDIDGKLLKYILNNYE